MQTKNLTRLHVGLNQTDGRPCPPNAIRAARRRIERCWDAFTITETHGLWCSKQEPAWIVERYTDCTDPNHTGTRILCADLAEILNQECIGLAIIPCAGFELIGGGE